MALGLSQSRLARLSGVSRFKICMFELGGGPLTANDFESIRRALLHEASRLRTIDLCEIFPVREFTNLRNSPAEAEGRGHER